MSKKRKNEKKVQFRDNSIRFFSFFCYNRGTGWSNIINHIKIGHKTLILLDFFNCVMENSTRLILYVFKYCGDIRMKRKRSYRWDRLIGMITILTSALFGFVIYADLKGNHKTENVTATASQAVVQQTEVTASDKTTVCIDPGHGGNDSGAEVGGKYEKDQVLSLAKEVKKDLEAYGINVVMTRTTDVYMDLKERTDISNAAGSVAMVSLHRNYYKADSAVKGVEAWIHSSKPADSLKLSDAVLNKLATVPGVTNRGIKEGTIENKNTNYYINSHSKCASTIIELGFMTNNSDMDIVTKNSAKTAQAIADGIKNYLDGMGYKYG